MESLHEPPVRAPMAKSALDETDPRDGVFRRAASRLRDWVHAAPPISPEASGGRGVTPYPAERGR